MLSLYIENGLFTFINCLRKSPKSVVSLLEKRRNFYNGKLYQPPYSFGIMTNEGTKNFTKLINHLETYSKEKKLEEFKHSFEISAFLHSISLTKMNNIKAHELSELFLQECIKKDFQKDVKMEIIQIENNMYQKNQNDKKKYTSAQRILLDLLIEDTVNSFEEKKNLKFFLNKIFLQIGLCVNQNFIRIALLSRRHRGSKYGKNHNFFIENHKFINKKIFTNFQRMRNINVFPKAMALKESLELTDMINQRVHTINDIIHKGKMEIRNGDVISDSESDVLDFKVYPSSLQINNPQAINGNWYKIITTKLRNYFVSFSNTKGGVLLWGVHDKSTRIEGEIITDEMEEIVKKKFDSLLKNVFPQVECQNFEIKFIKLHGNYINNKIIMLIVKKSEIFYVYKEHGGFKSIQRLSESNLPLDWLTIRRKFSGDLDAKDFIERKEIQIIINNFTSKKKKCQIVCGEAGIGKSFVVSKVIKNKAILLMFNKIVWIFVGDLKTKHQVKQEFLDYNLNVKNNKEMKVLIILDDVYTEDQLSHFFIYQNVYLLITTKKKEFLKKKEYQDFTITLQRKSFKKRKLKQIKETPKEENVKTLLSSAIGASVSIDNDSVTPIMKLLKVKDFREVEKVLKENDSKCYQLVKTLQIFPKRVYIPLKIIIGTKLMSTSDITYLERRMLVMIQNQSRSSSREGLGTTNYCKVVLFMKIDKIDGKKIQEKFVKNLMILVRDVKNRKSFGSVLDYYFKFLFFHLRKIGDTKTMKNLIMRNYRNWILPKFLFLRSISHVIKDFGYFSLKNEIGVKALLSALKSVKDNWTRESIISIGDSIANNQHDDDQIEFTNQLLFRLIENNSELKCKEVSTFICTMEESCERVIKGQYSFKFIPKNVFTFQQGSVRKRFFSRLQITCSTFFQLENIILFGFIGGNIKAYEISTASLYCNVKELVNLRFVEGHKKEVTSLFVHSDSNNNEKLLLSSSSDCCVIEWNLYTGSKRNTFNAKVALRKVKVYGNFIFTLTIENVLLIIQRNNIKGMEIIKIIKNINDIYLFYPFSKFGRGSNTSHFEGSNNSIRLYGVSKHTILKFNINMIDFEKNIIIKHHNNIKLFAAYNDKLVILDDENVVFVMNVHGENMTNFSIACHVKVSHDANDNYDFRIMKLSKDHVYMCKYGRILKFKLFNGKYLGFYKMVFHEEPINLFLLNNEIISVLLNQFEFLNKQSIVKAKEIMLNNNFILSTNNINQFYSVMSCNKIIKLINVNDSNEEIKQLKTSIGAKCVSKGHKYIFYQDNFEKIIKVDFLSGKISKIIPFKKMKLSHIQVSHHYRNIIIGQTKKSLQIIDTNLYNKKYTEVVEIKTNKQNVYCRSAVSKVNSRVYIGSVNGAIEVFEILKINDEKTVSKFIIKKVKDIIASRKKIYSLKLSYDSKFLIFTTESNVLSVYNLNTNQLQSEIFIPFKILTFALSNDNHYIIISCIDFYVRVFKFGSKQLLVKFKAPDVITALSWLKMKKCDNENHKEMRVIASTKEGNIIGFKLVITRGARLQKVLNFCRTKVSMSDKYNISRIKRQRSLSTHYDQMVSPSNSYSNKRVDEWKLLDVSHWLASKNKDFTFYKYPLKFEKNHINGEVLLLLKEDHLKEIGIESVGHRLLIMKYIQELKKKNTLLEM